MFFFDMIGLIGRIRENWKRGKEEGQRIRTELTDKLKSKGVQGIKIPNGLVRAVRRASGDYDVVVSTELSSYSFSVGWVINTNYQKDKEEHEFAQTDEAWEQYGHDLYHWEHGDGHPRFPPISPSMVDPPNEFLHAYAFLKEEIEKN